MMSFEKATLKQKELTLCTMKFTLLLKEGREVKMQNKLTYCKTRHVCWFVHGQRVLPVFEISVGGVFFLERE
jgi:hypothetical protein